MNYQSSSVDGTRENQALVETNLPGYVLITPARDEAQFIELTIKSVLAQSIRPLRWVIVNDGSADGTEAIVSNYAAR